MSDYRRLLTFADHLGSVGGTQAAQLAIFAGLSDSGWQVDLFYQDIGDYWDRWQSFASSMTRVRATLPTRSAPVATSLGATATIARGIGHRPSVIYVHNAGDVPAALAIGEVTRAPVVAHLHLPPPNRQPRWLNSLLRRAAAVVAPSADTARRWTEAAHLEPARVCVIPTGIDLTRFVPRPESERNAIREAIGVGRDDPMILFVGRVERIKGVHFLLDAACRIRDPARVVVCGAAADLAYLEDLRQKPCRAIFLGGRNDVSELMAAADLVVVPSNWLETQGLVVHEAMACGTPVVASDIGGLTDSMAGFPEQLVRPADVGQLAEAIERHVCWRSEDPELGPRSRAWVEENMSLEVTVEAIANVLRLVTA